MGIKIVKILLKTIGLISGLYFFFLSGFLAGELKVLNDELTWKMLISPAEEAFFYVTVPGVLGLLLILASIILNEEMIKATFRMKE
jgi:hypothetical protein